MKKKTNILNNNSVFILAIILGVIFGLIFKTKANYLLPIGNLFINLLSTIIVPLIFVTITLSISKMNPKNVGKLLKKIFFVFILMSLIAVIFGLLCAKIYKFSNPIDFKMTADTINIKNDILNKFFEMLSVNDFGLLLSKDNMIAIIIASIITGVATFRSEKKDLFINLLTGLEDIINNVLKIIMYIAPLGIMAYTASLVGNFGTSIIYGYLKVFIYYFVVSIIFSLIIYSLIAKFCHKNIKDFWKNALPLIFCSFSTCSSASCMPINLECTEKMGIDKKVSKTTISLGTSFHKDGSIIDSVFKIMFLVYMFEANISLLSIIFVALIASLLITAVPIGGGTISEMLIITMLGFPVGTLPILTTIATITDPPATMLNSLGDTSASVLVDYLVKKDTTF